MPGKIETTHFVKKPINPLRIRSMPRSFAPIDRQLVLGKHIGFMSPEQVTLYTFLECVSDPQGLSFYSDTRICEILHFSLNGLRHSRDALVGAGLLLYRRPIYQLLNLPEIRI